MSKSGYGLPLSRLSCFAMAEEEGKAWFAWSQANGLYEYDRVENRARLLMRFLDFPVEKGFLYHAIEKVGNILVLAPSAASKIVFYDLATDKEEYLEFAPVQNESKIRHIGACYFFKSFRHGDSVYFFGYEYPAVLKIDVKTKHIVYLTDWVKEVEQRIKKISYGMGYVSDCVVVRDYVWALCECTNSVLCLDLRTDEIKIVDICSDLDMYCGICFDGNFWVTGYNESANKLLKYDRSFVLEKEIEICSSQRSGDDYSLPLQDSFWAIYPVIDLGERLLLFSVYPKHVYEFDKNSNEVRILSAFEELLEIRDEKLHDMGVLAPRKNGDIVCFITGNDFLWNEYDCVNDTITRYEVRAESNEELLQIRSKFINGRVFTEDRMVGNLGYKMSLSRFLEHIAYVPESEAGDTEKDNNVGARIHEKNS